MTTPGEFRGKTALVTGGTDGLGLDLCQALASLGAEHVTPATLFLLSRAACAITGQNLVVDAGKVMH